MSLVNSRIPMTPQDYLVLLKGRKALFLLSVVVVFAICVVVAFQMRPVYRSTAMILIEEPEVPPELVASTVTTYADQRIQMIKYRVMTSDNLTDIMNRFGLYRNLRESTPMTEILEKFREDIEVETIEANVRNPSNSRPTRATIAFTVSYKSPVPEQAREVANELVTLYLAENTRERQGQAAATTQFLTQEADRLAERVRDLEAKLAAFKRQHAGRLPHQLEANLAVVERAETEISRVEQRIRGLKERRVFLRSELERVAAQVVADANAQSSSDEGTPLERLIQLRGEYETLSMTLGPNHPELIRARNEIAALESAVNGHANPGVAATVNGNRQGSTVSPAMLASLNPVYAQLRSQLQATDVELTELEAERQSLRNRIANYEQLALATPEVEREYQALIRNYENAQRKYNEVKDKQQSAEFSQSLETERKSERFVLLEPPQRPTEPIGPGRAPIVGVGFVLAMATGLALVWIADFFDDRIRDPRQLAALTGTAPLVVVPYIETLAERRRAMAVNALGAVAIVAVIGVGVASVHYTVTPLDTLWVKIVAPVWQAVAAPNG